MSSATAAWGLALCVVGLVLFAAIGAARRRLPTWLRRPVPESRLVAGAPLPVGLELSQEIAHHFLSGFNAMLDAQLPCALAAAAEPIPLHFRPFFLEGASAAFMPRGWFDPACDLASFEAQWVAQRGPLGSGAWLGLGIFRAVLRRPGLRRLAAELEAVGDHFWSPRAWDGVGFKVAFADLPGDPLAWRLVSQVPAPQRELFWVGFGRGLVFQELEAPARVQAVRAQLPAEARAPVQLGRGFALVFTHLHRLEIWLDEVRASEDEGERRALLGGGALALKFRKGWDPTWLQDCLLRLPADDTLRCAALAEVADACLDGSCGYLLWQAEVVRRADALWLSMGG